MKAKDVRGFLIDDKDIFNARNDLFKAPNLGWNSYRYQIGEREITLSREKLIKLITGEFYNGARINSPMKIAEAIIASEADILESPTKDD